jgi:hypothetical protein
MYQFGSLLLKSVSDTDTKLTNNSTLVTTSHPQPAALSPILSVSFPSIPVIFIIPSSIEIMDI